MTLDLKAIEERNQMCLDQAIDEGWDEGDIARILFDEDVPALVARVKELEAALAFYADQNNWDAGFGIQAEELAFSSIGHDWGEKAKQALYPATESDTPV